MWDLVIKIGLGVAAVIFGAAVTVIVATIIDKVTLKKAIKDKYQEAAKALIKSKDAKTLIVGIYDNNDNTLTDSMKIESDKGISSDIEEGQIIYL